MNSVIAMPSREIQKLIDAVELVHGPITLYGSSSSESHGTGFTIAGVPATFSVLTLDGTLPPGQYNIQIEGLPQGDYVYVDEVDLNAFLELVSRIRGPEDQWP